MKNESSEHLDIEGLSRSIGGNAFSDTPTTDKLVTNFDSPQKRKPVFVDLKNRHTNNKEVGGIQPIRKRRTEKSPIEIDPKNIIKIPDREGTTEIRGNQDFEEPIRPKEGLEKFYHKLDKLDEFADQIESTPEEKVLENVFQTVKIFTPEEQKILNEKLKAATTAPATKLDSLRRKMIVGESIKPEEALKSLPEETGPSELDTFLSKKRKDRELKVKPPKSKGKETEIKKPQTPENIIGDKTGTKTTTKPEIKSKPLKTAYEAALERITEKENKPPKEKASLIEFNIKAKNNGEIRGVEEKIKSAESFEELIETINSTEGIQGSQRWFSKNALLGRLHLVQVGEMTLDQIPLEGGLRKKVIELQTKNGPLIYKPEGYSNKDNMPTKNSMEEKAVVPPQETDRSPEVDLEPETEKTPISPSEKIEVTEKEVREKINTLIGEKFTSSLNTLNAARKEYCYQLTKKTQHDNTQSKIGRLVASLQSVVFAKKPSENAAIFEKASEVYFLSIQAFKKCLNDKDLNDKLVLLAGNKDSKDSEIIREEKEKMWEPLIQQILVLEKKTVCEAEEKSLPEKDRNMLDRMQILYRKSRWNKELSDKKPSFLEKIEGILKSESSERYDY